jgi:hypothetical protein
MPRWSHAIGSCALLVSILCGISRAHAQETPEGADRSPAPRAGQDDTRRYVTVTVNPLGLALARYGGNIEVSPFPHHVLTGSLYSQSVPMWLARALSVRDELHDTGGATLGGELGYRLYSGRSGADGLFAGGSFVSMPRA